MNKEKVLGVVAWGFVKRYRITLLFWIIILLFGLLSYTSFLKREGFPAVNVPFSLIRGTYLVNNPIEVDKEIIQPISLALESVNEVSTYQATATGNTFAIAVEFNETTSSEAGTKLIQDAIDKTQLPESLVVSAGAIDASKFDNQFDLLFAVYSEENTSYEELQQKATTAAQIISNQSGIKSARVDPVVEQFTDPATDNQTTRQTAINRVGIKSESGFNYYPAVSVGVIKDESIDAIGLYDSVDAALQELRSENIKTEITADFATSIDQQISSLQSNLISGLIAVLVVALLFISWRAALVIALFIPTVMATSFLSLSLLGFTLNTITLFALILTLGLFVDDATILVEAIDSHRKDKGTARAVITAAVGRVGFASIAGTLTTVLVFTPMLFVSGILGEFIRLLPLTVIIALLASLTISLILIPFLARIIVIKNKKRNVLDRLSFFVPLEQRISSFLGSLPLLVRRGGARSIVIYAIMIGFSLVAVLNAGFFFEKLRFEIFPQSKDSNQLRASIEFTPNTNINTADEVTRNIDETIKETVGQNLEYVSYLTANERMATIEIGLTPYQQRSDTSADIINQLDAATTKAENATITFSQLDAGPPEQEFPFQMRVYAEDTQVLRQVSEGITSLLSGKTVAGSNDEPVKVSQTKVDGLESVLRSEKGQFVLLSAQYNQGNNSSAAVAETQKIVEDQFNEQYLSNLQLNKDALDFNVSQESDNAESFSSIGTGIMIALALMYVLLVLLYDSFSQPLLILLAIPFSFFGVAFGLWATDNSLSFFVMIGFLGLIGIVVNNAILLVEYANQERRQGADRFEAISKALKDRFRPLITTTLTTISALIPLALSDPFWQPLAYTLIFGMASSATLIVLAFPYYYLLLEKFRDYKNRKYPFLR